MNNTFLFKRPKHWNMIACFQNDCISAKQIRWIFPELFRTFVFNHFLFLVFQTLSLMKLSKNLSQHASLALGQPSLNSKNNCFKKTKKSSVTQIILNNTQKVRKLNFYRKQNQSIFSSTYKCSFLQYFMSAKVSLKRIAVCSGRVSSRWEYIDSKAHHLQNLL